jgi:hypothetical protein
MINQAIDRGNDRVKERLDQLNGIVQSAIFNIDQVISKNLDRADGQVRRQRLEAVRQIEGLVGQVNEILSVGIARIDEVLATRLEGLQNSLANALGSLPITVEPLINVRGSALAMIRETSPKTQIVLTGSALFKDNIKPTATLIKDTGQEIPISVDAASMGLLLLSVASNQLPNQPGAMLYRLKLKLNKGRGLMGYGFANYTEPTLPIYICGALNRYAVDLTMTAANGKVWERKTIDWGVKQLNCTGGSVDEQQIKAIPEEGWELDLDQSGFHGGLAIGSADGDGSHREGWGDVSGTSF